MTNNQPLCNHLRFVHFSLVVTSLVMLATMGFDTDRTAGALKELRKVQQIIKEWNAFVRVEADAKNTDFGPGDWLRSLAQKEYRDKYPNHLPLKALAHWADEEAHTSKGNKHLHRKEDSVELLLKASAIVGNKPLFFKVKHTQPNFVILDQTTREIDTGYNTNKYRRQIILPEEPKLRQVKEFWDLLYDISNIQVFQGVFTHAILYDSRSPASGDPRFEFIDWVELDIVTVNDSKLPEFGIDFVRRLPTENISMEPVDENPPPDLELVSFKLTKSSYSGSREDRSYYKIAEYSLGIPAYFVEMPFSPLAEFIDLAKKPYSNLRFAEVFSALSKEASLLESLSLETIAKILEEKRRQQSEQFEAFGVKAPINLISEWGFVLVFGQILYFFLHYSELCSRISVRDSAWATPWVGLYASAAAKLVFVISAMVLPVSSLAYLFYRTSQFSAQAFLDWRLYLLVASFLVSCMSAYLFVSLWHRRKSMLMKLERYGQLK